MSPPSSRSARDRPPLWLAALVALGGLGSATAFGADPPATNVGKGTPAFQMERQVIAPGGGRAGSDGWQLEGTHGQVAVGRATSGAFTLDGGYWTAEPRPADIFSNGFEDTP